MNTNIHKKIRRYLHQQTLVTALFVVVAISIIWNTIGVIQKNYTLQKDIAALEDEVELVELENQNIAYQIEYYKTDEFLELAARRKLNKAAKGEHVVYLPKSDTADQQLPKNQPSSSQQKPSSNVDQWIELLFNPQEN